MNRLLLWLVSPFVVMFYSIRAHRRASVQVVLSVIKNHPDMSKKSDTEQAELFADMLYRSGVSLGVLRTLFTLSTAATLAYLLIKLGT